MAWLFGGKRSPTGQPEVRAGRDRQINNLHERVPGLQLKSNDSSLYEVKIRAPPDGAMVVLRVFLPTKFPAERPVLQLLSQVSHPWVNQYMQVIGHPDLHGWDVNNPPMIGDIVAAVIREFGRDAPQSSSGRGQETSPWGDGRVQSTGYSTSQPTPVGLTLGGLNVGVSQVGGMEHGRSDAASIPDSSNSIQGRGREISSTKSRRQLKDHTPIPAIPTKFDKLEHLTTQQLGRLLEDDVARQALLLEMTSVAGMKDLKTEVCKGNVETARSTLSKQESARILRAESERMKQELKALQTSYEGKAHERNKNMGGTADQVILKQVKHASKVADTSSESVAGEFLEKHIPAQEFLEEFLKERQRYHMLAAKIECMKRDIRF